jgi:hypothetical protein
MATMFGSAIGGGVDLLVKWVIVPIAGIIPVLVRTGLLFLLFATLWLGFLAAIVGNPEALEAAWAAIASLPLVIQAIAWILFLPLMGGLWVWTTDWSLVARVALVAGIAGWNLLVFLPRHGTTSSATSNEGYVS